MTIEPKELYALADDLEKYVLSTPNPERKKSYAKAIQRLREAAKSKEEGKAEGLAEKIREAAIGLL